MKLLKFGLLAAAVFAVAHAEEEFDEGEFWTRETQKTHVLDVGEVDVEVEGEEAPVLEDAVEADEADLMEEVYDDDEGTGARDVDIHAYFPEAQISAGKVAEVLVSVRVSSNSSHFEVELSPGS